MEVETSVSMQTLSNQSGNVRVDTLNDSMCTMQRIERENNYTTKKTIET